MKKQGNLFFYPKNGFFGTKKVEITLISRAISTSVTQRYKISKRNANPLTLVNTNIISHFSSFFAFKIVTSLAGISNLGQHSLRSYLSSEIPIKSHPIRRRHNMTSLRLRPLRLCVKNRRQNCGGFA